MNMRTPKYILPAVEGFNFTGTVRGGMKQLRRYKSADTERTAHEFWQDQLRVFTAMQARLQVIVDDGERAEKHRKEPAK